MENESTKKNLICINCDHPNLNYAKFCEVCGNKFEECAICGLKIGKDIVLCPFCKAPYHKSEFLEWLKVKAHCKKCNKEIDMWEFQKYLAGQDVENKSLKCPNCGFLLPMDADFCVNCGVKLK